MKAQEEGADGLAEVPLVETGERRFRRWQESSKEREMVWDRCY